VELDGGIPRSGDVLERKLHVFLFWLSGANAPRFPLLQFHALLVALRQTVASNWAGCHDGQRWHVHRNVFGCAGNSVQSMQRRDTDESLGFSCYFNTSTGLFS
jgi:hypothetical protein